MQILKIKNFLLSADNSNKAGLQPTLQDYLFWLELENKQSWSRTKFVNKHLLESAKQLAELKKEVAEKNTKKDKDGKPVYLKDKKEVSEPVEGSVYAIEDMKKFEKEMLELLNDELIIDITPANSGLIADVRESIMQDKTKYKGIDAARYAEYCESLEPKEAEVGKKK